MKRLSLLCLSSLTGLAGMAGCASSPVAAVAGPAAAPSPVAAETAAVEVAAAKAPVALETAVAEESRSGRISPVAFEDPVPLPAVRPAAPTAFHASGFQGAADAREVRLDSLEAMALAAHPAIIAQRALVQAARGNWVQVGLPLNPSAQYQGEEIGNDDAAGLHSLQLSQTWVTGNKLGLARSVAAAEIRQAEADLATVELRVRTRVRTAFVSALVAQQRVEQTARLGDIANRSVESIQQMLAAAEVSRIALLQAETEAANAQIAVENASANLDAARRALAAAAGLSALPDGRLAGDLDAMLPEMPWESLLAELVTESPEVARADSELERARRALRLACARIVPNVTTQAGVGYAADSDDTYATVGVSVPLPIRDRNQGNIARARAEIMAADAAVERTQLDLSARLAAAVGRYRVARQRVETLEQSVVPRAEEALELSQRAFQAGESNFLELLTVQRTLSQTRLSVLEAVEQAAIAAAEIDGMLVTLDQ